MNLTGLWFPLAWMAADWIAVARRWKRVGYLTKPAAILALLGWLFVQAPSAGWGAMAWIGAALVASLAGDIFLMLPKERFRLGLFSFLAAHLLYIVAFNQEPPPMNLPGALILAAVGLVATQLARPMVTPLQKRKSTLVYSLVAYLIVISGMVVSALWTLARPEEIWSTPAALLVSGGALTFFISDAMLAWNRFVAIFPHARLRVRIAYHLGQVGLVLGALFHYWGN